MSSGKEERELEGGNHWPVQDCPELAWSSSGQRGYEPGCQAGVQEGLNVTLERTSAKPQAESQGRDWRGGELLERSRVGRGHSICEELVWGQLLGPTGEGTGHELSLGWSLFSAEELLQRSY